MYVSTLKNYGGEREGNEEYHFVPTLDGCRGRTKVTTPRFVFVNRPVQRHQLFGLQICIGLSFYDTRPTC